MSEDLGKKAEKKIKEWLDRPDEGYDFNRIPDQLTGQFGSKNICDFELYLYPYHYYIESKSTEHSRFDFSMITDYQYESLLKKSCIRGCYGLIVILFASHKRAFIIDIETIKSIYEHGKKSINIDKIDSWDFPYCELQTIPNSRKHLLDYEGPIEQFIPIKRWST